MTMATFVIVPGAFTTPAMFEDFCNFAGRHGITAVTVALATVGRNLDQPAPDIGADVQAICQIVEPLLDDGREVILVTSSLGGVVGTQCLELLSATARASNCKRGGIQKIVYVSSLILEPHTSALDFFGPEPPPIMNFKDGAQYATWIDEVDDGTLTFSDLPKEEAWRHKAKMAMFHSRANFENKLTYPGYKYVRVYYVICENDKIIPKETQLALVETLKRYATAEVMAFTISAGHLPLVTRVEDTLQILRNIADD